eukprot:1161696-Pelagomonas_calceolata.AAC.17
MSQIACNQGHSGQCASTHPCVWQRLMHTLHSPTTSDLCFKESKSSVPAHWQVLSLYSKANVTGNIREEFEALSADGG